MDVPFAGCAAVVRVDAHPSAGAPRSGALGRACELGDERTVRFAIADAGVVVRTREAELTARAEDGRVAVDVPRGASEVVVTAPRGRFVLRVVEAKRVAWIDEARAKRKSGDLAAAESLARAHADAPDAAERAFAKGVLARVALSQGRADEAFPLFRDAIEADRADGRLSDAIDDSFALAFAFHQRSHRYADARATLDAIAGDVAVYPEGRAREPYYRGILASETGDHRTALGRLREAEARARELGMKRLERNAKAAIALEMQATGRARASLALLRELEKESDATPCERVEIANDLGWGALLANEAAGSRVEDARAPLEHAVAVEGCQDVYPKSFALGNLARLAVDDHDAAAAKKYLEKAQAAVREPRGSERLSWLDLQARTLLEEGAAEKALAGFDEERRLARAALLADAEWSALVGRGGALAKLGRKDQALAALAEAEDVVDRATLLVPLGDGRGSWVADRSASARMAVELLVAAGRIDDAARVAWRSRTRVLASVERGVRIAELGAGRAKWEEAVRAYRAAREAIDAEAAGDWKLDGERLAAVGAQRHARESAARSQLETALSEASGFRLQAPGEEKREEGVVSIVIHPTSKGWIAIAIGGGETTAYPIAEKETLLAPISSRLAKAGLVRVEAYGEWRKVDVHALAFEGAPLVARVAVEYPLGLRAAAHAEAEKAVVVGDPTGDLPRAHGEAKAVARTLAAQGPVVALLGAAAARGAALDAMTGAGTFHYAGHGVFAGEDGFESALPLADGARITIGDVLALAPAPRRVVLSGCDAARSEAEGLGLAQAFLAAGAEEVVAPVRPVSDALAEALANALYGAPQPSLARALRAAQLAVRAADAQSDWAAFRALAP